jgi:hypothetical protein
MTVSVSNETRITAQRMYERGISAHLVAKECALSYEDAIELQAEYAEELRQQAAGHRLMLRHSFRSQLTSALNTLVLIHQASQPGYRREDMVSDDDVKFAKLRVEAAKALISAGQKFIDDDIINLHTEKPQEGETKKTVFDFTSAVKDDGATILQITPRKTQE